MTARLTKAQLELDLARAAAIYCPRCGQSKSGWDAHHEERRVCFVCHAIWIDERLKLLIGRTETP